MQRECLHQSIFLLEIFTTRRKSNDAGSPTDGAVKARDDAAMKIKVKKDFFIIIALKLRSAVDCTV